ncbi:uncharacterized protein LOC143599576 [Bidens hawaiensis]|uniref:uncharacterized protein LOC143599576 n=1 Tax=Bidens hawaiensis TaxID=980011 RepID=UPI00404B7B80
MEVSEVNCEKDTEKSAPMELKVLPSHLEYGYLEEGSNLPVIVSSKLMEEEKMKLIEVLKLHKGAIAWRLSDIQGISPAYCTHRILMENEYKPVVQLQRRLYLTMQEVVKKEVLKLMDAGVIYPISDSPWVSPTQVVPKKGMTIVTNEKNELIPSRIVTGWCVCIDYRRLNDATRKYHFPLPFIDQMLERLYVSNLIVFLMVFQSLPFELMCDASDYAVGAVLGKRHEKHFHLIYYARKTLNDSQENYTTNKKELLAVVFTFDKFRSCLVLSKTTVFTYYSALCFLFKGNTRSLVLYDGFFYFQTKKQGMPWFTDFANYLSNGPFLLSGGYKYILVAIDYVSKWVEAQPLATNDAWVVVKFLKKLFTRFGTPRAIISDRALIFATPSWKRHWLVLELLVVPLPPTIQK